jgi:hypothetical protein
VTANLRSFALKKGEAHRTLPAGRTESGRQCRYHWRPLAQAKAMTCCLFSSFKTLLTLTEGSTLTPESTSSIVAGFQVIIYGRFWVFTESCGKNCSFGHLR